MKILVLSHISEYFGGAEKSLVDLMNTWNKKHDIEIEFIIRKPKGSLVDVLEKNGWKYNELKYSFWCNSEEYSNKEEVYRNSSINAEAVISIENIIEKYKPDLVVTNSIVCPWAAFAANNKQVPHVWFVREYGDIDHGRSFEIGRKKTFEDIGFLSQLVVTNSKTLKAHVQKYIETPKLVTLYNPFDIGQLNKKADQAIIETPFKSNESLKLVITGSLTPSKGQFVAVEAINILKSEGLNCELCIVGGNGPSDYRKKTIEYIHRNGLESIVHQVGYKSNVMPYVKLADLGIMASRQEAFGRVTFEYMAAGKPVIGSNSGATPELIENNFNGILFEPKRAKSLAEAIKKYYLNRNLISVHGNNSVEKAKTMIMGVNSEQELWNKIKTIAKNNPKRVSTNYDHKWIENFIVAKEFIDETKQTSVKVIARQRLNARYNTAKDLLKQHAGRIKKSEK